MFPSDATRAVLPRFNPLPRPVPPCSHRIRAGPPRRNALSRSARGRGQSHGRVVLARPNLPPNCSGRHVKRLPRVVERRRSAPATHHPMGSVRGHGSEVTRRRGASVRIPIRALHRPAYALPRPGALDITAARRIVRPTTSSAARDAESARAAWHRRVQPSTRQEPYPRGRDPSSPESTLLRSTRTEGERCLPPPQHAQSGSTAPRSRR